MDVQVVYHEKSASARQSRVGGENPLEVTQEIGFRAGWSTRGRRDDAAAGDIAAEDERAGAVTDVLEFAPSSCGPSPASAADRNACAQVLVRP